MCSILNLIDTAKTHLSNIGLADSTIQTYQERSFNQIIRRYEEEGDYTYDQVIMEDLIDDVEQQYIRGSISRQTRNWRLRGVKILQEIYETGNFDWKVFPGRSDYAVRDSFAVEINELLDSFSFSLSEKHVAEIKNIVVRYAVFLDVNGIVSFQAATPECMRRFLDLMHESRPKSMDKVVSSLKKLYTFLETKGMLVNNVWMLLASPRSREHYVKPAIPQTELIQMVNQIDRMKAPGKRDYAIFVLAITTGLRAGDIVSIKLADVFWQENEIRLIQGKTNQLLILPLQSCARDALADYILNERPTSKEQFIFLRSCAPYSALRDGGSVASIFRKYLGKAGIIHQLNDGRTFHGIRRSLATTMVTEGVPVTTVSQVLGHQAVRATKQYVSLDIVGLRKCVLPLSSIGGDKK